MSVPSGEIARLREPYAKAVWCAGCPSGDAGADRPLRTASWCCAKAATSPFQRRHRRTHRPRGKTERSPMSKLATPLAPEARKRDPALLVRFQSLDRAKAPVGARRRDLPSCHGEGPVPRPRQYRQHRPRRPETGIIATGMTFVIIAASTFGRAARRRSPPPMMIRRAGADASAGADGRNGRRGGRASTRFRLSCSSSPLWVGGGAGPPVVSGNQYISTSRSGEVSARAGLRRPWRTAVQQYRRRPAFTAFAAPRPKVSTPPASAAARSLSAVQRERQRSLRAYRSASGEDLGLCDHWFRCCASFHNACRPVQLRQRQ